jgi:PAS domain S-box-containing protein
MLLRIVLYTLGIIYPLAWLINWFFDSATPGDFAQRFLFFVIFTIAGTLLNSSKSSIRETVYRASPFLLGAITYHSLYKCYMTVFSLEYVSLSYLVFILSAVTFTKRRWLVTYIILAIIGNFLGSVLTLPRVQFFHHFIPAFLTYLGILIIMTIRINEKDALLLQESYIRDNILTRTLGVIITDIELGLIYINDEAKKIINVGFRDEFLYGSKIIFPVKDEDRVTGELIEIELANNRHLQVRYIKAEWMGIPSYLILVEETTQKVKLKKEKNRIMGLQENAINYLGEGVVCLDTGGFITYVNPRACALLQMPESELIGEFLHSKIHHTSMEGTSYDEENFPVRETYTQGIPSNVSFDIFWRKDGTYFYVEYQSTPLFQNGKLEGAVMTFNDSTIKKEKENLDKKYASDIFHLSTTSNKFLEIYTEAELYRYIADEVVDMIDAKACIVNTFDSNLGQFITKAYSGIEKHQTEIYQIIGRDLKDFSYHIDPSNPILKYYMENFLDGVPDGLFGLNYGNFSHKICLELESILNSKKIISLTLKYKDTLFGNVIVFLSEEKLNSGAMLEIFQQQASINLHRKFIEKINSRERFRFDPFIQETSALYCEIRMDGTILFINPSTEVATGYSNEEVVGKNWWNQFQPGDSYSEIQDFIENVRRSPKKNYNSEIVTKKGYRLKVRWDWIYRVNPDSGDELLTGLGLEVYY